MRKRLIFLAVPLSVFFLLLTSLHAARSVIASLILHRTEDILEEHFHGRVEFADFRVSFAPRLRVTITELTLRYHGRKDIPPLIHIAELTMTLRRIGLFGPRQHIANIYVAGLQITMPPRETGGRSILGGTDVDLKSNYPVVIDFLQADDAKVILLRSQPGKSPLEFPLHHLELSNLSFEGAAKFRATLTNAVPKGEIDASGLFGPWNAETPRATPVQAEFRFEHADLGTIKGLQGILSSRGTFSGPLDYLAVKGSTDTPDFTLRRVANPLALHTDFTATVDGTNGNTYLHSVAARFLRSTLSVKGEVVDQNRELKGRTIELDADSENARIEDLIGLAVKTNEPILTGLTRLTAKIYIPEEDVDLSERLKVTSQFRIDRGQFTNPILQEKVDSLSRKGQGQPKDNDIANVPSQLTCAMHFEKGIIHFPKLRFVVHGAKINLQGSYTIAGGALNFHGDLFLDAKLSQTTTGAKALLLKAVDPFFVGKEGGSKLPIKIVGTREHPQFGFDRGATDKEHSSVAQTN